ncbi:MAG: HTH domain-containing protein [Thaumarchaeota archaeon]|nr:HTH domain-containing protein [Nitrososphaerota archaeon]
MNTFKDIAFRILQETGKPLHSKEITKIAQSHDWLVTAGKTPEATMNAQLIVDINTKKERSRFIKTAPSTFALNPHYKQTKLKAKVEMAEPDYKISKDVSTKQKGDIAESRIAELVTLYGDTTLACYKPLSDDEGIDLIVKEKGSLKTLYIQIKSRFGNDPAQIFTATTKARSIADKYSMAVVFCYFDITKGDLWDYLWFVPAPDFIRAANKLKGGEALGFVAGRKKKESNKWDKYLIEKRQLANRIIEQMRRVT